MQKSDGMNYAPQGVARAVCGPGEFRFAVIGLDHGHIYGMCNGLREAGAELVSVYDPDPLQVAAFLKNYPGTRVAASEQALLEDSSLRMIASASPAGTPRVLAKHAAHGILIRHGAFNSSLS